MDVVKLFEERYIPFTQVLDSIAEGVCIAGANFEFIYWNHSARDILFDEPDDSHQSTWASRYGLYDLVTEKHLNIEDLPMVKALNGETFSDYRILSRIPRNPEGYILSVNRRLPRTGICAVAHDITREVDDRIQIENERVKSAHVSKLASLGTLAAEIAHELRNPMTILSTSTKVVEAMIERNFPEKGKLNEQLGTIQQTVFRMNEVINSLNSLSRDSTHEASTKFKVEEMLHDIEVICAYRIRTARIQFAIEYPKGDPGFLCAHQIQISEVILNLVTNAFDAVESMKEPSVWIKVWKEFQEIIFEVYDSGPGVIPAHRSKIFEPYFTTKSVSKGTGLGLSIASKIVKQHNGTMEYHH